MYISFFLVSISFALGPVFRLNMGLRLYICPIFVLLWQPYIEPYVLKVTWLANSPVNFCLHVYMYAFLLCLQVVDMRWGVREEALDDHLTVELCMRELELCQRLSTGPNFVVRMNTDNYKTGINGDAMFTEKNRNLQYFNSDSLMISYNL